VAVNLAGRVARTGTRAAGPKVYSLHAPEVECIGKGKPHKPMSSRSSEHRHTLSAAKAASSRSMPRRCRNPYDGHTPAQVISGDTIERIHTDAGYRGHNAPPDYKFKVYTSKQKRGVNTTNSTGNATARRHRTGHRPHQTRASHGPELSRPPSRDANTPSSLPLATTSAA